MGTVTDPTGAVVPNAQLTITDVENGFVRTTTEHYGQLQSSGTPHGTLPDQGGGSGFKTFEQKDITLECE